MQDDRPFLEKASPPREITLFEELLECLEKEWQALITSQEDAILSLAAQKEQILEKIMAAVSSREGPDYPESDRDLLNRLKDKVGAAQARNHRLIATALETIQEFLATLKSPTPGIYQATGKVGTAQEIPLFQRQA